MFVNNCVLACRYIEYLVSALCPSFTSTHGREMGPSEEQSPGPLLCIHQCSTNYIKMYACIFSDDKLTSIVDIYALFHYLFVLFEVCVFQKQGYSSVLRPNFMIKKTRKIFSNHAFFLSVVKSSILNFARSKKIIHFGTCQ